MLASLIFVVFMLRKHRPKGRGAIHHYFNGEAPAGHIPDASEIPYWTIQLPEHY